MNAIAERMARQRESLEAKEKAIEAFNEQNYKGAVDLLKKAIKLDPDNHIFYSNRAAAFMALEQYEKALVDADECIRLQNATYVRCTKQELQLVMDAIAQRKEESLEFKERAIEGAWQRLWNSPEQCCRFFSRVRTRWVACLVSTAFNVQNFKRAEQHLSSAIELDPENHVFYSNRACKLHSLPTGHHKPPTQRMSQRTPVDDVKQNILVCILAISTWQARLPTWLWRSLTGPSRMRTSACGCSQHGQRAIRGKRLPSCPWRTSLPPVKPA